MSEYDDQLADMEVWGKVLDKLASKAPTADQRTIEWLQERVGHCTASMFAAVVDVTKAGKEGAKRRNYRTKLVVERLMNAPASNYVNPAMEWGTAQEASARMAYEARTGAMVEEVGFLHHTAIKWVGGSPDGLVGKDGMIECKCPFEPAVHVTTILTQECEHLPQIQGLLWITGRQWCDFVSFDPRMPTGLELYVQRVKRDDDYIAELGASVIAFLTEVDKEHQSLLAIAAQSKAAPQAILADSQPDLPSPVPAAVAPINAAAPHGQQDAPPSSTERDDRSAGGESAAPHTERLKTALSYASKSVNERFKGQMIVKGYKTIEAISADKADALLAWIEAQIDKQAAT